MIDFGISILVDQIGENFVMSGISSTSMDDYGNPTYTYTSVPLQGIVQFMDGSEEEVKEGLLQIGDITVFVDDQYSGVSSVKNENLLNITSMVSGVFRIINVVKNPGHYEIAAKRLTNQTP